MYINGIVEVSGSKAQSTMINDILYCSGGGAGGNVYIKSNIFVYTANITTINVSGGGCDDDCVTGGGGSAG